mmetsp:Transcript_49327/g.92476  ORF Transcript_49327/g.92476 Transcript_49327/m.92476 type:complete len:205 (-) Transcript_49327:553-1167(-)
MRPVRSARITLPSSRRRDSTGWTQPKRCYPWRHVQGQSCSRLTTLWLQSTQLGKAWRLCVWGRCSTTPDSTSTCMPSQRLHIQLEQMLFGTARTLLAMWTCSSTTGMWMVRVGAITNISIPALVPSVVFSYMPSITTKVFRCWQGGGARSNLFASTWHTSGNRRLMQRLGVCPIRLCCKQSAFSPVWRCLEGQRWLNCAAGHCC